MMNSSCSRIARFVQVAALFALLVHAPARAQDVLGGHFGFALPLVTRSGDETITLGDQFKISFPFGVNIKTSEKVSVDMELVPTIQKSPYIVTLTVHPGVLYALPDKYVAGIRMAFDVNQPSWGFTPLLHRNIAQFGTYPLFAELDVPIRFQDQNNSIGLAVHFGIGF
jgi:hypothetical protein